MSAILDIELLRTFHAVSRSGRFKAAAEQLHKSPAAISVHIQRLESIVGGRLLERDNQSVSLTALGRRLLVSTTELLHTHDRVLSEVQGSSVTGRIRLGVPDEYADHVIRDILPCFAEQRPNVVLEVKTGPSLTLREQVRRGRLHAAVAVVPKGEPVDGQKPLAGTTPVWVGAANGPSVLADPLPLALYAAECPYREAMLSALRNSGRKWRVVLDSPSSQAVKACVETGMAITLLDRSRVTGRMVILAGLPEVAEHDVVFLTFAQAQSEEPVVLLSQMIGQYFRL
ncbi:MULTISPECIES: LysR family transcriptional regulator [Pseudomonas]|uniref:LysR family transcriptional regulator n=1 Tax=Pseudomonas TaxID=286 RepID=UPI001CE43E2C|nr:MULTISPECIES: LysR family transcriptional regulator [Pseudomonas]MCO7597456.1 LysR family transcriptional regulator [Pseudomonas guariconensis]MCO7632870.1 LysR family transcriptional regulator [Pseudomonas guariconensis]MCU7222723.1 LysR family transcriptional regulator [Pseudomonas brassicacearum]